MQGLRGWGCCLEGDPICLIKDAACCRVAGVICELYNVCRLIYTSVLWTWSSMLPTSSTFSYVFRFEAQGEVTSSIQTLSLHMKFLIFLCLYPVDHAYNECLLTSTCASQLTSRIFQKLKDLNDVGVLMQKCIFSALPRYLLAAEWTLILIFTRQLPWQNCSTGKFLTLGIACGSRTQWESF